MIVANLDVTDLEDGDCGTGAVGVDVADLGGNEGAGDDLVLLPLPSNAFILNI